MIPQVTLREIREKQAMTQLDLEKASGHSVKSISKWERRQGSYPNLGVMGELVAGMGGQMRLVADFDGEMYEIKWEKPDADDDA